MIFLALRATKCTAMLLIFFCQLLYQSQHIKTLWIPCVYSCIIYDKIVIHIPINIIYHDWRLDLQAKIMQIQNTPAPHTYSKEYDKLFQPFDAPSSSAPVPKLADIADALACRR